MRGLVLSILWLSLALVPAQAEQTSRLSRLAKIPARSLEMARRAAPWLLPAAAALGATDLIADTDLLPRALEGASHGVGWLKDHLGAGQMGKAEFLARATLAALGSYAPAKVLAEAAPEGELRWSLRRPIEKVGDFLTKPLVWGKDSHLVGALRGAKHLLKFRRNKNLETEEARVEDAKQLRQARRNRWRKLLVYGLPSGVLGATDILQGTGVGQRLLTWGVEMGDQLNHFTLGAENLAMASGEASAWGLLAYVTGRLVIPPARAILFRDAAQWKRFKKEMVKLAITSGVVGAALGGDATLSAVNNRANLYSIDYGVAFSEEADNQIHRWADQADAYLEQALDGNEQRLVELGENPNDDSPLQKLMRDQLDSPGPVEETYQDFKLGSGACYRKLMRLMQ